MDSSLFKKALRNDFARLFLGVIFGIILIILISIWRFYDTKTFLFLQLMVISLVMQLLMFIFLIRKNYVNFIADNWIVVFLIGFTIASVLLLNVDRSRSFYTIKWVGNYGQNGVSQSSLTHELKLTPSEVIAISQRLTEQVQSGTLYKSEGIYRLTSRGKILNFICHKIAIFANLKGFLSA